MSDVKRLLDEATPLPWHAHTYGHRSIRQAAGMVTRSLFQVGESVPGGASRELRDCFTDLTYVHDVEEGPHVAMTGNGPRQTANAALIVHAVNRLPDYEAAVDALEAVLALIRSEETQFDDGLPVLFPARAALRRLRDEVSV